MERKLCTVRQISAVKPIEGADLIEAVQVDGWWVVAKKDEFPVGTYALYFEIDSWIPTELAPFLSKGKEPREYNGIRGERLRTVKLKGQLSQGLLLPAPAFVFSLEDDADLDALFNVQKWEPPAEFRSADTKGNFPSFIPKTDQERIQNIKGAIQKWNESAEIFQVTEKLDGSSLTMYYANAEVGVCSRNLDLKRDEENTFWKTALSSGLIELENYCKSFDAELAIQGEMIGPNIQGNKYKLDKHKFYCYDIFDIKQQKYLKPSDVQEFCTKQGILHVPVIGNCVLNKSVEVMLQEAEGKSVLNTGTEREGLVYKHPNGTDSFKVISNKWLLKHE